MRFLYRFWHWLTMPCGYCRMPLYLGPRYHLEDGSYCCPEHYNLGLLTRYPVHHEASIARARQEVCEALEMRRAQAEKE